MGDSGPGSYGHQKKRSIDEMIEHMTADLQSSDGQYIQLGFTPPPTPASPHAWSEYSSGATHPFIPPPVSPPVSGAAFLKDLSSHFKPATPEEDIVTTELPTSYLHARPQPYSVSAMTVVGNPPNSEMGKLSEADGYRIIYGGRMSPTFISDTPQNIPQNMDNYLSYHSPIDRGAAVGSRNHTRDYGLFSEVNDTQQSVDNAQIKWDKSSRRQLIDNVVGNWIPTVSGTYTPFGGRNKEEEKVKKRVVGEVRPMRPSYSAVVSKVPPVKQNSIPNVLPKMDPGTNAVNNTIGSGVGKLKQSAKTKSAKKSFLKRQHSGGGEDFTTVPIASKVNQVSGQSQCVKLTPGVDMKCAVEPCDWVQLDDLEDDKLERSNGGVSEVTCSPGDLCATMQLNDVPCHVEDEKSKKYGTATQKTNKGKVSPAGEGKAGEATLLNNDKTAYSNHQKPNAAKRPLHINNNLGTNAWQTAQEKNLMKSAGVKNCKVCLEEKKGNNTGPVKSDAKVGVGSRTNGKNTAYNCNQSHLVPEKPSRDSQNRRSQRSKKRECQSSSLIFFQTVWFHILRWGSVALHVITWFLHLLSDVLEMSSHLLLHLCTALSEWLMYWLVHWWRKICCFFKLRLLQCWRFFKRSKADNVGAKTFDKGAELESNIPLPSTGEEAMKRLLACKGKDPYSILGVKPDCSDDDIKKYYKRQAFLVHPDKNNQPGAEEAFKILVHAFELIGEPERRKNYDRGVAKTQQDEQAWSELSELLTQLQEKMEEAANTIRCTNCGKRHRRVSVERPCYAARFCAQCKIRHAAREGDIWAESSVLGFLWHYYACMDGAVYDITEWAACQADNLRHLKANTHNVQYRIVLGKRHGNNHRSRPPECPSEPDLEEFLNNLYNHSGGENPNSPQRHDQAKKRKGRRKK